MANPFDAFKDILNEETPTQSPPDTSYVKPEPPEVPIKVNPFSAFENILKDKEVNASTEAEQSYDLINTNPDTLMTNALESVKSGNNSILEQDTIEDIDFKKASEKQYSPPPIDIVDLTPKPVKKSSETKIEDFRIDDFTDKLESVRIDTKEKLKKYYKTNDVNDMDEELRKQISSSLGKDVSIDSMKNVISKYGGYVDNEKESLDVKMTVDEKGNLNPVVKEVSRMSDLLDPSSEAMNPLHKAFPLITGKPYDENNPGAGVTETLEKEGYLNESQKMGTPAGKAYPLSVYLKAIVHRALGSDPEAMYEQPEDIVDTYKGVTANALATILNLPFIPLEMADHVWRDVQASDDPINTALNSTGELTGEVLKYFAHTAVNVSLAISPFSTEEQQAKGRAALYEDPMGPLFTIMGGYGGVKTGAKIKKGFKEAPVKVQTAGNNLMAAYHYYRTGTKPPKELQPFVDVLNTNPNAPGIAQNLINALEGVKDLKKPKVEPKITPKITPKVPIKTKTPKKLKESQKPLEEQKSILDEKITKINRKKDLTKSDKQELYVSKIKERNIKKKIEFNKKTVEERKKIIRKQGKLEYEITEIKNALKEQKEFLEPREITSKKETITEKLKEIELLKRELKKLEPKGKTTELHGGFGLAKREISEFTNYIKNKIKQGDENLGIIYNSYFNEKNKNFSEYGLLNEMANKVLVFRDRDGKLVESFAAPRQQRKTPEYSKFLDLRNKFIGDGMKIKHEVSNLIDVVSRYEQKDKNILMDYLEGKTDISNIKDVKLQKVGKIVRHRLDNYGKELVNKGLISKEAYSKHKGEYLANIYEAHWVGKSPTQTGVPKIRQDYNNHRAGVSESRKLELGERVSLETTIYESIIREKNDLLTVEFLNQILENPKWAKKESIIEVGGKKYGEIALETELANVNAVISKKKSNKQPVPKETQQHANNLQKALDAHKKKVSEAEVLLQEYNTIVAKEKRGDKLTKDQQNILDAGPPPQFTSPDFVKIEGQGYGNLNGVLVDKGIAENLRVTRGEQWGADWMKKRDTAGTPWITKDRLVNGYINFTNTFKAAKVPFNLPTVSRNMVSTSFQLNQANMSLTQQIKSSPSIIKSMKSKDKSYMEALENGLFKGTMTTEYFQFLEKYTKNLTETTKKGDSYLNAIWDATKEFSGKKAKNVTDFYGAIDNFYKFMYYKHLRNQGKGVKESVRTAQDVVIDYSLISPTMAAIRQHPVIGMPFITYSRKILPRTIQSIRENPMRSTAIIGLPILYSQFEFSKYSLQLQNENFNEDTWDLMQVAMGERMRENAIVLPMFDSEGRPQVMDLTYNLPWGSWQEVGRSLISLALGDSDDIVGSLQEVGGGISNNFGLMPGPSMYMAIKFGIIPTAGGGYMEIYDALDTPTDRALSVAQFTRNLLLPGMLNENGALDKTLETAGFKQTNIYDTKLTSGQAAARWIGLNVYPVDIGMGTLKQTKKFTYLIGELHRDFNRELNELKTTQGIEDVDKLKDDILQRYIPKMMQIYDDIYGPIIEKTTKKQGFDSLKEMVESKLDYGKEENYDESWEDYQKRKKKSN